MSTDQALVQSFIDGAFGLPIAYENEDYAPVAGTAHAELMIFKNEQRGFTLSDLDDETGLLQIKLKYPTGAGALDAKTMEAAIFAAYPIGAVLTYGAQSLEVRGKHRLSAGEDGGWYALVLRINFVAYLPR